MNKNIILLDMGNVLLKPIHGEIIELLFKNKKNNLEYEEFKSEIALILNDSFDGKITLKQTWDKLFDLVEIIENREKIINGFSIKRNEELIEYVKKYLSKNCTIGILSDLSQIGYYVFNNYYNDLYELCDKDNVFVSVNTGMTKSKDGENYFRKIVKQLNVSPKNIIFIDDEINNINNAKKVGINTILFESRDFSWEITNEKLKEELKKYLGEC